MQFLDRRAEVVESESLAAGTSPVACPNLCFKIALHFSTILYHFLNMDCDGSDVIGDCCVIGDVRWAGTYGVDADFVALEVQYFSGGGRKTDFSRTCH